MRTLSSIALAILALYESTNAVELTTSARIKSQEPATRVLEINPAYSARTFSSENPECATTWNCNPQLDSSSTMGFTAVFPYDDDPWQSIDSGKVQPIAGVVMQGRSNRFYEYLTEFTVAMSDDGEAWTDVDGGKTFDSGISACDGAHQRILFDSPVEAQYIKLTSTAYKYQALYKSGLLIVDPAVAVEEAKRVEDARKAQEAADAAAKVEAERVEAERVEAEKEEAREAARVEAARVEAERVEAERVEAARISALEEEAAKVPALLAARADLRAAAEARAQEIAALKAEAAAVKAAPPSLLAGGEPIRLKFEGELVGSVGSPPAAAE